MRATPIASSHPVDTRITDYILDLRNLFAVIASGVHLLQDRARSDEQALLLHAIDSAATCGGDIARVALAQTDRRTPRGIDINSALADLEPALAMTLGIGRRLKLDLCADPLPLAAKEHEIQSVVIELALNASRVVRAGGGVTIRTRRIGSHAWLLVADNGRGLARTQWPRFDAADRCPHGLPRIERWLRDVHGRLHWRSSAGAGTVVALDLPLRIALHDERRQTRSALSTDRSDARHFVAA